VKRKEIFLFFFFFNIYFQIVVFHDFGPEIFLSDLIGNDCCYNKTEKGLSFLLFCFCCGQTGIWSFMLFDFLDLDLFLMDLCEIELSAESLAA
jgi:hypothetical protein